MALTDLSRITQTLTTLLQQVLARDTNVAPDGVAWPKSMRAAKSINMASQ